MLYAAKNGGRNRVAVMNVKSRAIGCGWQKLRPTGVRTGIRGGRLLRETQNGYIETDAYTIDRRRVSGFRASPFDAERSRCGASGRRRCRRVSPIIDELEGDDPTPAREA